MKESKALGIAFTYIARYAMATQTIGRHHSILYLGDTTGMQQFFKDTADEYKTFLKSAYYSSTTATKRQLNMLNKFGFRISSRMW